MNRELNDFRELLKRSRKTQISHSTIQIDTYCQVHGDHSNEVPGTWQLGQLKGESVEV